MGSFQPDFSRAARLGDADISCAKSIPPFAALRAFEAVGRLGGIRKAAAALSLHHAVVSRHVAALERWVGQPLIVRDRSSKFLTEAGARYHSLVHEALKQLAGATAEITGPAGVRRLRIWTNGGFASKWLAPRLAEFSARHPGFEIELRPSDSPPDLRNGEAEADIRYHGDRYSPAPGGPGLAHIELARPHIMAVAAPDSARSLGPVASATTLLRLPLLHEEDDQQWRAWFAARGHVIEGELAGPRLWHAHLAIDSAVNGRGVALASSYLVAEELNRGLLVRLEDPEAPCPEVPLGAYVLTTRADRWDAHPLRQLRNWLIRTISSKSSIGVG